MNVDTAIVAPTESDPVDRIVKQIEQLAVMELVTLVKRIEERFGVSSQPISSLVIRQLVKESSVQIEEQDSFSVRLDGFDLDKKLMVIKTVRAVTNMALKAAKDFTEAGGVVMENLSRDKADALAKTLTDAGARVSIV